MINEVDRESDNTTDVDALHADFCGQVISMPEQNDSIERACVTHRMSPQIQDDGTVAVVPVAESLLHSELTRANRGLAQVFPVVSLDGGPVVAIPGSRPPLPEPSPVAARVTQQVSTHVLQFVRDQDLGIIGLGPNVSRSRIIGEIASAYPEQSIAVLATTRNAVKKTVHELRKGDVRTEQVRSDSCPSSAARVVVGTYEAMGHDMVELDKRDFILTLDAREALSERAQLALIASDLRGRLFGFVKLDEDFAPLENNHLAATFGFHQADVPIHGFQPVVVDVEWLKFRVQPPSGNTPATIKRNGVWRSGLRNRLLAKYAKSAIVDHRVVMLVDSIKHACRLGRHLADWPISIDADSNLDGLSTADHDVLLAGRSRWISGTNLIATATAFAAIRPHTFDTVIWAGSGPGLPPIPTSHLICSSDARHQMTVVDIRDRHHPLLRRWSRMRREAYIDAGWFERQFQLDPATGRAVRFVHDRLGSET